MESFVKIVNSYKKLIIFKKRSILDVWQDSELASDSCVKSAKHWPDKTCFHEHFRTDCSGKRYERSCAYQGVRNVRFSENLVCFVFL